MRTQLLSLFLQQGGVLKTTASVVPVTFTWLLVHPTVLAAQMLPKRQEPAPSRPPSDEAEFAEALAQIELQLTRLQERLAQAGDTR